MFIKNGWYLAAWADEVGDKPLGRRICNEPIVMYREASTKTAAALADVCIHRGAPLSAGRCVATGIECGYHGMIFGANGACKHIPGQVQVPENARVRSYPLVEKDGCLWIWMGEPSLSDATQIIDYPMHNDPVNWPHMHTKYSIAGNAMLMVDNLMDLTHFAYTHRSTIGGTKASDHVEAIMDVDLKENGVKVTRWMLNHTPPPTYRKAAPNLAEKVDRWGIFDFTAPGVVVQWSGALDAGTGAYDKGKREGGYSVRALHGLTPETETSCHYFWCISQTHRKDDMQATRLLFDESETAFREDQVMVESQQKNLSEFGEKSLINVASDRARVHMRRIVEKIIAAEARPS